MSETRESGTDAELQFDLPSITVGGSSDSVEVAAVISWTFGLVGLIALGIVFPALLSIVPDAIGHLRRRGKLKPLVGVLGASVVDIAYSVYMFSMAGAPGSPSKSFWIVLATVLAIASGTAGFLLASSRAWARRQSHRAKVHAADDAAPIVLSQWPTTPGPRRGRLGWRDAEYLAAEWMRYLGAEGVEVTPERRDGGVDVVARGFAAQVKCWVQDSVGVALVRQLHGVVSVTGHRGMFFSTTGYTPDAQEFARDANVALFVMRPELGRLVPIGPLAQNIWSVGLEALQVQRSR